MLNCSQETKYICIFVTLKWYRCKEKAISSHGIELPLDTINTNMYNRHKLNIIVHSGKLGNVPGQPLHMLIQLEQLECLHSEDTPRSPMITHTIDSYWVPSQKKTNSKLQF